MMTRVPFPLIIAALIVSACTPDRPSNKFADPVRLKIADLKDKRLADSLYPYLEHAEELYRADAADAFGSLQDTTVIDKLGKMLLHDPGVRVREAAAFALGQTRHAGCVSVLLQALKGEHEPKVLFQILKAYGKTTQNWQLDPTPFLNDSITAAGTAWSLYHACLRGKTDSTASLVALRLLDRRNAEGVRLAAAHYFSRTPRLPDKGDSVLVAASGDPSPEIRMAIATALGKIPSDSSLAVLKRMINNDPDPRVAVNAIRSLGSFPLARVRNYLYEAVTDKRINVAIASSEVIISKADEEDWIRLSSLTNRISSWRVLANLYEAALRAGQNQDLEAEIETRCAKATDPYSRAAFIRCFKSYPPALDFVVQQLRTTNAAVVRSAAAEAIAGMGSPGMSSSLRKRLSRTLVELMRSDDPAVLAIAASALADPSSGYRANIEDHSFLAQAAAKLVLPRDNEALQAVRHAIAYFQGVDPSPVINPFNHPIDWSLVENIPAAQKAVIKTTHGNIVVRLLVNEAPGSVANFVDLAEKDYFDNKFFHRVVPNFVVQAGCPRGDGWGSEAYSIRSEFSRRPYRTGSLGMASAGKDTECTQWFITHSPTPHLEGRYTIFGEVIQGLRVLEYLEVGDRIVDVEIDGAPAH